MSGNVALEVSFGSSFAFSGSVMSESVNRDESRTVGNTINLAT